MRVATAAAARVLTRRDEQQAARVGVRARECAHDYAAFSDASTHTLVFSLLLPPSTVDDGGPTPSTLQLLHCRSVYTIVDVDSAATPGGAGVRTRRVHTQLLQLHDTDSKRPHQTFGCVIKPLLLNSTIVTARCEGFYASLDIVRFGRHRCVAHRQVLLIVPSLLQVSGCSASSQMLSHTPELHIASGRQGAASHQLWPSYCYV